MIEEALWPKARLDADYTARNSCSPQAFDATIAAYLERSALAKRLPYTRTDLVYDPETGLKLDLFGTVPGEKRPLVVFIHGGYWRALSKEHSAFLAPMLEGQEIALAAPDYRLAPAVGLTCIIQDMRRCIAFLWEQSDRLGIDRRRIIVTGSSAGGHLAAALVQPGWQSAFHLPDNPIAAALPVSGLFELAPIAASHVQDWMRFKPDEIADFSPLRHLPHQSLRLVVAKAEHEAEGFHRQSCAYADATGAPLISAKSRHHFDVVFDLADPSTELGRALLDVAVGR